MTRSSHAAVRAQQRCIPPLIEQWLDQFGEEKYDGNGGILLYFSRASIRAMERAFGRAPVRKMTEYLDAYKVESSHDGRVLTIGHRTKRLKCR
ncbi:hypothetical protein SAMN05216412_10313 [Nitrosospira multiformis]|uniref:Uncharacterized protein n=1 Tax=Nitrosospira multiformis TaxID=1231 RepID=A0A1I0BGT1_9PROT|nr:hypothetical protein [Nitrosospira multiformis]SET06189.1 hypothetical protein SAMN05216412_10313 [Nitrosospira multiformis]